MTEPVNDRLELRGVSAPTVPLPAGAWETHAHVFGPFEEFPLAPGCPYAPPLAPRETHAAMLDTAGFSRGVLVHASAAGFDNSATLDAVAHRPERLIAVAVVPEDSSDEELRRLHAAGVRGLRFTEMGETAGGPKPPGVLGLDALQRLAPRLRALGWHAQIWAHCRHLVDCASWLTRCGIPVVIDHMGMFEVERGVQDVVFQSFLDMVATGSVWVKLMPVRITRRRRNDAGDVRPFFDALCEKNARRLLWGSDWPFIALDDDLPTVGQQIDLFDAWSDGPLRQQVFVTNPAELYGDVG